MRITPSMLCSNLGCITSPILSAGLTGPGAHGRGLLAGIEWSPDSTCLPDLRFQPHRAATGMQV